jgi:hypothetical protein
MILGRHPAATPLSSAYVSIRQHTSACSSDEQAGGGLVGEADEAGGRACACVQRAGVANTLRATCFFSIQNFRWCMSLPKLSVLELFCCEEREFRQMHHFLVACDVEEGVRARMPDSFVVLKERLGPKCQACFVATPTQAPVSQEEVSAILRGIGLSVQDKFRCPKSSYSIDMRVQDRGLEGSSSRTGCGAGWAVKV